MPQNFVFDIRFLNSQSGGSSAGSRVDPIDPDGFLMDVDVQPVSETPKTSFKDRSRDVDHFFSPAYKIGDKNHRNCRLCS
jgi:hypothetical protein